MKDFDEGVTIFLVCAALFSTVTSFVCLFLQCWGTSESKMIERVASCHQIADEAALRVESGLDVSHLNGVGEGKCGRTTSSGRELSDNLEVHIQCKLDIDVRH
jgi:hypothetical protein